MGRRWATVTDTSARVLSPGPSAAAEGETCKSWLQVYRVLLPEGASSDTQGAGFHVRIAQNGSYYTP